MRWTRQAHRFLWLGILVGLAACAQPIPPNVLPASSFCEFAGADYSGALPADANEPIAEIDVWARPYQQYCGRILAPVLAAPKLAHPKIAVHPRVFFLGDQPYANVVKRAFQDGTAPDILFAPYDAQLILWWQAGYIEPLENCLAQHREYDAVWPFIKQHSLYENTHVLGVPIGVDQTLLYFNRNLLHDIGWSQTKIDNLPAEIARGDFTLQDMHDVAQYAVESGRVAHGYAIWSDLRPSSRVEWLYSAFARRVFDSARKQFILDQTALESTYRYDQQLLIGGLTPNGFVGNPADDWMNNNAAADAFAHGRVLFWVDSSRLLSVLYANYPNQDPAAGQNFGQWVGLAAIPTARRGTPAVTRWNHVSFYAVVARDRSRHKNPQAACALLAQTLAPEINQRLAQVSRQTDVLTTSSLPSLDVHAVALRQLVATARETEYNHLASNRFWPVLQEFFVKVETGSMTPATAAREAVRRLRVIMPDELQIQNAQD